VQRMLHKAPCGGSPAVAAFADGRTALDVDGSLSERAADQVSAQPSPGRGRRALLRGRVERRRLTRRREASGGICPPGRRNLSNVSNVSTRIPIPFYIGAL